MPLHLSSASEIESYSTTFLVNISFFHKLSVKAKAIEFKPFSTMWHGILMELRVLKNYVAARRLTIC